MTEKFSERTERAIKTRCEEVINFIKHMDQQTNCYSLQQGYVAVGGKTQFIYDGKVYNVTIDVAEESFMQEDK
jgi:hypothetical protein